MAGSLLITAGARAGERISVDGTVVLGREGTDVVLDDPEVSRRHALIRVADGAYELEDLGSRNGTRVNGERISGTVRLPERARIRVGQTELLFEAPRQGGRTVVSRPPADSGRVQPSPPALSPALTAGASPSSGLSSVASRQTLPLVLTFLAMTIVPIVLVVYFWYYG